MINIKELSEFLVEAKRTTYASGDEDIKVKESDNSTTIVFEKGDWLYHDNYFGGEPYGGREVVFYKNKPVYMMVYYGKVHSGVNNVGEVYGILMGALKEIPIEAPYRGPKEYIQGDMQYTNNYNGDVTDFSGSEMITKDGKMIYEASYIGGLVDN